MAVIDTNTAAPFGAITVHRIVSTFEDALNAIRAWNKTRRTVSALRALSPRQLDDIGLTRADVDGFASRGF